MPELKQELTNRDLKKMFGVTKTSIYNWRKQGLEFYKLGGNGLSDPVRYRLEDVRRFAHENGKIILVEIF